VTEIVVVTGMSGAGRTQVGNALEDLGWFVIDNLPASLIPKLAELVGGPRTDSPRVALVIGSGAASEQISESLAHLRESGVAVRTIFLDASTEVLIRRYESTKRRHPFSSGDGLAEAIDQERDRMTQVREGADLVIDTSQMTIYHLRTRAAELFSDGGLSTLMQTSLQSFGYKHGLPRDVDLVIDCRFLPNPFWDEELRPLTGLDAPVKEYLFSHPETQEFLDRFTDMLELLLPLYQREGKTYLTIALGCTGGQHRSVAIVEALAATLRDQGVELRVAHRDLGR
jgi:UPF0042 nucleotide-binding protein